MMPPLLITSCDIFIYIHPSKDYVLKLRKHSEIHNVFPYIYSDLKELLIDSKTMS
jgi:hypothetical protein